MGRTASSFSRPCAVAETSGGTLPTKGTTRAGPRGEVWAPGQALLHGTGKARCVGGHDLRAGGGDILQATQGTLGWT